MRNSPFVHSRALLFLVCCVSAAAQLVCAEARANNEAKQSMTQPSDQEALPGIPESLAKSRKKRVSQLRYALGFELEASGREDAVGMVRGSVQLRFELTDTKSDLLLDFDGEELFACAINGKELDDDRLPLENGHLRLRAASLRKGSNDFVARFRSKVAPTGTPLTSYRDSTSGEEYLYTLVVPADAHRLFPCFDQPDLKGRFTLELTIPKGWIAVANGAEAEPTRSRDDGKSLQLFRETKPISTYLFAFAAGPFQTTLIQRDSGSSGSKVPMRIFHRASKEKRLHATKLFQMHDRAIQSYEPDFGHAYPFGKLDIVLCPGFPYGGMEHAGAIFYRESALVFDHEATVQEELRRSTLIYHEVSHQWFGNLVTMRWFDDLWLKEGFATFTAYRLLEELEPERHAWLRFGQSVTPSAYALDATRGSVPVYQALRNLNDAKSNYGPIVYNKAPAVLRELERRVGAKEFWQGVRLFVKRHAFDNATWRDLIACIEESSKTKLESWSKGWLLTSGMPRVSVAWEEKNGKLESLSALQASVQENGTHWPLTTKIRLAYKDGKVRDLLLRFDDARKEVPELAGSEAPLYVLPNPDDVSYALVVLDEKSAAVLENRLESMKDPLARAVAFRALFESVRAEKLSPHRFAKIGLRLLAEERDALTHARILSATSTAIFRYQSKTDSKGQRTELDRLLRTQLVEGEASQRLSRYRSLTRVASSKDSLDWIAALLTHEKSLDGLTLGPEDLYAGLAALLANKDERFAEAAKSVQAKCKGKDVQKYVYQCLAATPNLETKAQYFASYLDPDTPPEQWIQGSLSFFHFEGQAKLTLPFLAKALERAEWVKEHRRIFFMPAWLGAFIGAHNTKEAQDIVEGFLASKPKLPIDIRRKLLFALDELRRAVRIRKGS